MTDDDLITHATVRDMCGRVTGKTLRRWGKTLAFPVPVLINNRLYWRRKEVSELIYANHRCILPSHGWDHFLLQ